MISGEKSFSAINAVRFNRVVEVITLKDHPK